MRPQRRVQRAAARPTYTRTYARSKRQMPQLRPPKLPNLSGSLIRVGIIGVIVLFVLLIIARATSLNQIKISGNSQLTTEHLTTLTKSGLKQQWLGRSLLLVNTGALEESLMNAEPAVKQAEVSRHLFHSITVHIVERQPSLNWQSGDRTYLLDADGTAIGPTKGEYTKLPLVSDSNALPVKVGQRLVPHNFIVFCRALAVALPAAGYPVESMAVPASTSEVYVVSRGLTFKFDTTRTAGDEVADLQQVQKELDRAKQTPTQYIDLRIEHKAYYK